MKTPISQDLRERIVAALEAKATYQAVADRFQVSKTTVDKVWQRWRRTGSCAAKPHGGGRQRSLKGHDEALRAAISRQADATLEELCEAMEQAVGVRVSTSTMCRELKRLRLPIKKKITTRANSMNPRSRSSAGAIKR